MLRSRIEGRFLKQGGGFAANAKPMPPKISHRFSSAYILHPTSNMNMRLQFVT